MARCLASAQPERSAGERRVEKNELLGAVGARGLANGRERVRTLHGQKVSWKPSVR